jgi:hypothetical protein
VETATLKRTAIKRYLNSHDHPTLVLKPKPTNQPTNQPTIPPIMKYWFILSILASTWGIARAHLMLARDPYCSAKSTNRCDCDNELPCCSDANTLMICQCSGTWFSAACGANACVVQSGDVSCCDSSDAGIAADCNDEEGSDRKLRMRNLETSPWN